MGSKNRILSALQYTVTDLYFLLRKHFSDGKKAKTTLLRLVRAVTVLDTTRELCLLAFDSPVADFEDAVLVESAAKWGADCIVTRNIRDFSVSQIKAIIPEEFISRITK